MAEARACTEGMGPTGFTGGQGVPSLITLRVCHLRLSCVAGQNFHPHTLNLVNTLHKHGDDVHFILPEASEGCSRR